MAEKAKSNRPVMIGLGVISVAVTGVLVAMVWPDASPQKQLPAIQQAVAPSEAAAPQPPGLSKVETGQSQPTQNAEGAIRTDDPAKPVAPAVVESTVQFDIVRIEPNGEGVIAGRGPQGATIEMLRNGEVHTRAVADHSGLFAIVPPPLPPGTHQIELRATAPDGTQVRSQQTAIITVHPDKKERPLIVLAAPGSPSVVLQNTQPPETKPQSAASGTETPAMPVRPNVEIVSVDIEQRGRLFLESRAAAGATVRFYLNDTLVAPGVADAQGKVSFSIDKGMRPGDYKARLDDVDPVSGAVKSRAEVAFNIPEPAPEDGTPPSAQGGAIPEGSPDHGAPIVSVPDIGTMVVSRGDSLWQISRRIYGIGYRYTYIYNANQKQIRNPDLIYPGQVFVLPRMENGTGNGEDSVPSVVQ